MCNISNDKLDEETVKKVANLSKLEIGEEELFNFKKDLSDILDYFNKIDEANTENVSPTSHVIDIVNEMREDKVSEELSQEDALKNSIDEEKGYFKGPRVKD